MKDRRQYFRDHYANRSDRREAIKERNRRVTEENKAFVSEYLKTHPCVDCGEPDEVVLEFDHVRGKKKFAISRRINSATKRETLEAEIAKCDVRCANCHRRKTAKQLGWR